MFNEHPNSDVDDDLFELLSNSRRRLLLYHLFDHGGEVPLRELSREVAAYETGATPEEVDSDETTNVYISLYQTHVPALEEEDVVDYNDTERVVGLGDRADEIVAVLRDSSGHRQWGVYYTAVALSLGVVVLVSEIRPLDVTERVVAVSTVGAATLLLLLAVGHYYRTSVRRIDDSTLDNLVC